MTPGRQQYLRLKAQHPDAILLYRMGDFYEMFDDDAHIAARVLGITLTSREFGRSGRVPMAGIPYHALNGYLRRFLRAGHRIAICEQLSEPGKGLVERDVTRVLSPGTIDDPALLDAQRPNYLLAIIGLGALVGLAWVDISTGACEYRVMPSDERGTVFAFVDHLGASEIIAPTQDDFEPGEQLPVRRVDVDWAASRAERRFAKRFPDSEPLRPAAMRAVVLLLDYLERGHATLLRAMEQPFAYAAESIMVLDRQTRANLEIDLRTREHRDLFNLLNHTHTAPGARRLRMILDRPLNDRAMLEHRLDAVEELWDKAVLRSTLAQSLKNMLDLERLATRIATGAIRPRELVSLAETLATAGRVRSVLDGAANAAFLHEIMVSIDPLPTVQARIMTALDQTADGTQGIQRGFDAHLDRLRSALTADRTAIQQMEQQERERTGIRGLKIGYNKVSGYYIEVSRANRRPLPEDFVRKQTLTNTERYITPALKDAESRILANEERAAQREAELYDALITELVDDVSQMRATAGAIAWLDALLALATVAVEQRYTRPRLTDDASLRITEGRHPIVERELPTGEFMPNDTELNDRVGRAVILTGPNMAGKSTWLRQTALIVFMAQVGSFVPANYAEIGLVDRIFTRIGAHDDLARGQSTFMVEMLETATILQHASTRSLVVLDEIGRGTSTEDGLAIAGAVVEHLAERIGVRMLFATHFRELAHLAERIPGVRAMQTAITQQNGQLIFLHSIVPGIAAAAFGLEIARLAGIPDSVIARARAGVIDLPVSLRAPQQIQAVTNVTRERVADDILSADIANMTPLEALNLLASLQQRLRQTPQEYSGPRALRIAETPPVARAE